MSDHSTPTGCSTWTELQDGQHPGFSRGFLDGRGRPRTSDPGIMSPLARMETACLQSSSRRSVDVPRALGQIPPVVLN